VRVGAETLALFSCNKKSLSSIAEERTIMGAR